MNKYTKILLGTFILVAVFAIMFRPTDKLMTEGLDTGYLAAFEEAKSKHIPVFIEFYGKY